MYFYTCSLKKIRINFQFKHVRFKYISKTRKEMNLSKEACEQRVQNLAETLSCNVFIARTITAKDKNIFSLDHDDFYRNIKFCKNYFKVSDLLECPYVLSLNSSLLQHKYFSLKELGCSSIRVDHILRFSRILKATPEALRRKGISFTCDHNFEHLTKYLDSSYRREINSRLLRMYEDGSSLCKIKETMNAEFLAAKFPCSIGKAHQLLHRHRPLKVQSIVNTDQLLNILMKKYGFSFSKICSSLSLLSLHPEEVEHFLSEIPELLGVNTVYIVKRLPYVFKYSIDYIQKVEAVLKDFNITETQLMCCPRILLLTPETLKERFTALCDSKHFSKFKSYKKFLWLVYSYNNLNPRLKAINEVKISPTINMFTVSSTVFDKYLRVRECRKDTNEIAFYLAGTFNIKEEEVITRLREYPDYQNSSLPNCQQVVEFLQQSGVTQKQIFKGVGIILYDADIVRLYFNNLKNHPQCQPYKEWATHYNLIQLLIYVIELDVGFQGTRIYKTECNVDEEDELLVNCSSN